MTAPVGRREFFALEAGEYLERLSLLATRPGAPDSEDLVRYARALRGAALMAGPTGYAVAAAAVESIAKAIRDGTVAWTPVLAERLTEGIEECKALLRRLREWSDVDRQRCDALAERLDGLLGSAGRRPPNGATHSESGLSSGVRAYVAREAAAVAATLEQVADALGRQPARESAEALVQRLQPLRGLGALPGLSPLPELLETLDLSIAVASRGGAWPPGVGRAFRATATALSRMARDIAELGIPQHDSHEIVQAAEALRETFARDDDIVPIGALLLDGEGDGVVRRGTPPPADPAAGTLNVELVTLADRFRHAAAQTREGSSRSARALSLTTLGLALRALTLSRETQAAAGGLVNRLDRETMSGRALLAGDGFTTVLDRAIECLAGAAAEDSIAGLAEGLRPLCLELDQLAGITEGGLEELDVIPIEGLAPDPGLDVVPVETLFYDPTPAARIPAASPPAAAPGYLPFERTFSTWFALERGLRPAAVPVAQIVPIESLAPEPDAIVSIEQLLYRGRRALERADLVRRELDRALKARFELNGVETLLAELLALVPLALDDDR